MLFRSAGLSFDVFIQNVQPGVMIDYSTGESSIDEQYFTAAESVEPIVDEPGRTESSDPDPDSRSASEDVEISYVLNTNTMRFHYPYCRSVGQMSEKNRKNYSGTREDLITDGYTPCGICKP